MPLQSGSIPVGATYAPTGGTARTLVLLDASSNLNLLIDESLSYVLRKTFRISSSEAVADIKKPGGYGPRKVGLTLYFPKQTADLKYFTNKVSISMDIHPEVTNSEIDTVKSILAAVFVDADFDSLLKYGSKA